MAKNDDCEPVFHMSWNDPDPDSGNLAISIRDWFAGLALSGILAHPDVSGPTEYHAGLSYEYADAMLKVRAKITKDGE